MGSVPTVFLRFFYVAVLIFAINPISSAESPQTKKKILMLAGPQSHEYGSHEHLAGLRILSEAVQNADDRLDVDVREGWPNDTSAIDNAAVIVIYCDGKSKHLAFEKSRRAKLEQLLRRGGGLVALHYATEMLNDESGDEWRNLLGGHFETHFSVNPEWIAQFKGFPQHPTTNGLKPFAINDEWYFHLRFSDQGKLTPILQAVAPESTMRRPDGDHSGNSLARKSVADGELQTVAWAFEPTMGGRSFGFTGGHYHWNWANTDQLMLLTNAIRWVSGNEIPKADAIAILGSMIAKHDQSYDVRSEAVRGLCKSIQGQQAILAMAESGHFPTEMQLLAGGMLSRSLEYDVKTKATVLLPVPDTGKASYLPPLDVLVSLDGDARHGMELFRGVATCANCHIVNGTGKEVGPNLSEIGDKLSREAMFAAIINPSDGISHNYEGYSALLNDGRVVTGLLFAETAERIVIRNLEAIDIAIDRNELIELKKNKKSIMPDGLLLTTNQQGLVDVVTYLTTLRKKP